MRIAKNIFELLIIVLFISIVAFYNLPPTGQQVAGATTSTTSSTTTTWPGNCGRPCSLAGGVGMLDINEQCTDVKQYYDAKRCCIDADCGEDKCIEGRCIRESIRGP